MQTLSTIARIVLRPRGASFRPIERSKPLIILGNGPSLRSLIDSHLHELAESDTMAVNFAANAPEFAFIKPKFYVLADPHFFSNPDDVNVRRLITNLSRVDWPMTLLLPKAARRNCTITPTDCLTVEYFNMNAAEGFRRLTDWAITSGHAMPRPRNVMIAAIMCGIRLGYRTIYLTGADHSWTKTLSVDDDNHVVTIQPHFYKEDEREIERIRREYVRHPLHSVLDNMATAFRSYHLIADYASRHNIEIINATTGSFIDAFRRGKLPFES